MKAARSISFILTAPFVLAGMFTYVVMNIFTRLMPVWLLLFVISIFVGVAQ